MSNYLKVTFIEDQTLSEECDDWKYRSLPFATSDIYHVGFKTAKNLTRGEDVKTVYQLSFDLKDIKHEFMPGDTIGVLPSNNETLVEKLLIRLGIEAQADHQCELEISPGSNKKIPKHLPTVSTLRKIFLNHVDLHSPPKKLFLKSLLGFASDEDQSTLTSLSSVKSSTYSSFITSVTSLLTLLEAFPSLNPPIAVLLEHLPPLQPRPYSICSSPLSNLLEITFFVSHYPNGTKGVCTGYLENLILTKTPKPVSFYFRKPGIFRIPDLALPVILIATGTGIAPFRGFFQHWTIKEEFGDVWLFYGCRYKDQDFLYREELNKFMCGGVINRMNVTYSREGEEKRYIQSDIERKGEEFVDWINRGARIFICGDFKTVVRDVRNTIKDNLMKFSGMSENEAESFVKGDRVVVDTWN